MNILFLSHYFPPEVNAPASRAYEHCKEWVRLGHKVTVITSAPNHPKGKVYAGYKNKLYQKEMVDGIEVIRIWTYLSANEGFGKRALNYFSYFISVVVLSIFMLSRKDIVLSTSPQFFNGLAGYPVSKILKAVWVLEIRDLWPESILAVGAMKNKKIISILYAIEKFMYKKADYIIPVTDAFNTYISKIIYPYRKTCVINNAVNNDFFNPKSVDIEALTEFKQYYALENKFVISYVGTHGMAHGLKTLLNAAKVLRNRKDIIFLLIGDGAEKNALKKIKKELSLDNVLMLPQLPKDKMPMVLGASDISIVHLKRDKAFEKVIPSKLFESMAMGKPVILGVKGEAAKIINQSRSGVCIEPENHLQMANAILALKRDVAGYRKMSNAGMNYVRCNYDRRKLAQDYLNVLSKLVIHSDNPDAEYLNVSNQ
ncbi:MAG TPA: glycosyltransferase family 4 protein [Pseudomonadales bacterium]